MGQHINVYPGRQSSKYIAVYIYKRARPNRRACTHNTLAAAKRLRGARLARMRRPVLGRILIWIEKTHRPVVQMPRRRCKELVPRSAIRVFRDRVFGRFNTARNSHYLNRMHVEQLTRTKARVPYELIFH